MIKKIAIDVDGVLADFSGRVAEIYALNGYEQKDWSINLDTYGIDNSVFWNYTIKNPDFYGGMKPMPDAFKLVSKLRNYGHDIFLATACCPGSVEHKARWIERYFGDMPTIYFTLGTSKLDHEFDCLIDDHPELTNHPRVISHPATYNSAFGNGSMTLRMKRFWDEVNSKLLN